MSFVMWEEALSGWDRRNLERRPSESRGGRNTYMFSPKQRSTDILSIVHSSILPHEAICDIRAKAPTWDMYVVFFVQQCVVGRAVSKMQTHLMLNIPKGPVMYQWLFIGGIGGLESPLLCSLSKTTVIGRSRRPCPP